MPLSEMNSNTNIYIIQLYLTFMFLILLLVFFQLKQPLFLCLVNRI